LLALANQQNGRSAGFINSVVYASKAKLAFRDITQGNNGAFQADSGWDACTGLGSPVATKLIVIVNPTGGAAKKPAAGRKSAKRTSAAKSARKLPGKRKPPTLTLKRGKSG
jgi:kumamolisin